MEQWTSRPKRASLVHTALGDAPSTRHRRLWPNLRVVSCWADASAHADVTLRDAARRVEKGLRNNYHYDYCRRLGQLGPLRLFRVTGDAQSTYLDRCVAAGQ